MLRILYDETNSNDSVDDIAEHNMTLSDLYLNAETLRHSAYAWITSDKNRNFQDLEKLFRKKNFNTYLIAKKITLENGFVFKTPNDNVNELLFECYFSCKPKDLALQEVLDKYGSKCHICNKEIDLLAPRKVGVNGWEMGLHLDHIVPLSKGGSDDISNVMPSHGLCNLRKKDKLRSK